MSDWVLLAIGITSLAAWLLGILPAVYIAARWGRASKDESMAVGVCWPFWVAVQPAITMIRWAVVPPIGWALGQAAKLGKEAGRE